ncbi:Reverse transcriptase precursor, partial [Phytophthora megakarya]
ILVDPYGSHTEVTPAFDQFRSPHFMAVKGRLRGQVLYVFNVYAPHQTPQREAFFRRLGDLAIPRDVLIAVGGDFNCTLDAEADRRYSSRGSSHDSSALRELLAIWCMVDPVAEAQPKQWTGGELRRHHEKSHTYYYSVKGPGSASSRLDRWYVSPLLQGWVSGWEVVESGIRADHLGATLLLQQPDDPIRQTNPAAVHPAPEYAQKLVTQLTRAKLAAFQDRITAPGVTAAEMAIWWDELKRTLVKETRLAVRTKRRGRRNTYKQKLRRLVTRQRRLQDLEAGVPPTVDSVTEGIECLTIDDDTGDTPKARLRREIADCKRKRLSQHQSRHFSEATFWEGKTTRNFFKPVSSKFADNIIRRLDSVLGCPVRGVHKKADTLADAWTPVLQQPSGSGKVQDAVVEWIDEVGTLTQLQHNAAEDITEAEITAAISASKAGKATGPDRLGNGSYRDYSDLLVPILHIWLNAWYSEGVFPPSFLEANIFCLKKSGNQHDALNYRPLAQTIRYLRGFWQHGYG